MTDRQLGQIFALGTAVCWTISSLSFEAASRRAGSLPVNFVRLLFAFCGLGLIGLLSGDGHFIAHDAPPNVWKWLMLSGAVGFFVGDLALFRAFVEIGARLSSLVMSLAPPLAAITAAIFLPQQAMNAQAWIGMTITLAGIVWVISERMEANDPRRQFVRRATPFGIGLALIGAASQGIGLVMSGVAMDQYKRPFAATQIRALAGIIGFALVIMILRDMKRVFKTMRDARALVPLTIGAIAGPLLGVSMLLKAQALGVSPGVAQTFTSLVPVLIIPVLVISGRERVTWRAAIGAGVAVCGVAILLLRG